MAIKKITDDFDEFEITVFFAAYEDAIGFVGQWMREYKDMCSD